MNASPTQSHKPILIKRNRVPRITLIKRPVGQTALRDVIMFFAGACTVVFMALLALVVAKFGWFR
jgi:hypothetical protein